MLTMNLTTEYATNFLHASHKLAGQNTLLLLQASGVQVKGVNETWGLWHISSTFKGIGKGFEKANWAEDELIPPDSIEAKAQLATHFTIAIPRQVGGAAAAKVG
jgi:hypothetical protein